MFFLSNLNLNYNKTKQNKNIKIVKIDKRDKIFEFFKKIKNNNRSKICCQALNHHNSR
jgi:hypothetical protein